MINETDFAIVDLETTGLFPSHKDRIIEIAIIRLNGMGETTEEYVTLINPNRDLGPIHIHGITSKEIQKAPSFQEVVGDVVSILSEAIFVAHNVSFDISFIRSEMSRLGYDIPVDARLCTISLAKMVDPCIPRSLTSTCNFFNVPYEKAHSAYSDALATSKLFNLCIEKIGDRSKLKLSDIGINQKPAPKDLWPDICKTGKSWTRTASQLYLESKPSFIARLVERLPTVYGIEPEIEEYLNLLDRVLEDRIITEQEAASLILLAKDLGLYREQLIFAHKTYMRSLVQVALEDGIITESEKSDLEEVRHLLSISNTDYIKILNEINKTGSEYEIKSLKPEKEDLEGITICFTGSFTSQIDGKPITRAFAEKICSDKGMLIKKTVTKSLDYLVAADPESMSGKAKLARKYGIRIIAEPVFWRKVRIEVD